MLLLNFFILLNERNALVYFATHDYVDGVGETDNYLFVSDYREECPDQSETGSIRVETSVITGFYMSRGLGSGLV